MFSLKAKLLLFLSLFFIVSGCTSRESATVIGDFDGLWTVDVDASFSGTPKEKFPSEALPLPPFFIFGSTISFREVDKHPKQPIVDPISKYRVKIEKSKLVFRTEDGSWEEFGEVRVKQIEVIDPFGVKWKYRQSKVDTLSIDSPWLTPRKIVGE